MKILAISDLHGLLRDIVCQQAKEADLILNAGDTGDIGLLEELNECGSAPVLSIRGNNDTLEHGFGHIPSTRTSEAAGHHILLIHNRKDLTEVPEGIDIVISGHSHKFDVEEKDGVLYVNPGSCGRKRFSNPITWALLETNKDGSVHVLKREALRKDPRKLEEYPDDKEDDIVIESDAGTWLKKRTD